MDTQAFSPSGNCAVVPATTVSASVALPGGRGNQIRVFNSASATAFCRWTSGVSTAVLTDTFVAGGGTEVFSTADNIDTLSVILLSGSGNVYAQRGFGS